FRSDIAGEVWLQTHHPEHPQLAQVLHAGYAGYTDTALQERQAAQLPPFGHLTLLRAESQSLDTALAYLQAAHDSIAPPPGVEFWGPVPAPMPRRAGRYRAQLMLHATTRAPLHALLNQWQGILGKLHNASRVRWSIDVDPQTLM